MGWVLHSFLREADMGIVEGVERFPEGSRRCLILIPTQAGGVATTGTQRILDVIPKNIHGRCPVFLGSKDDVEDLKKHYDAYDGPKPW